MKKPTWSDVLSGRVVPNPIRDSETLEEINERLKRIEANQKPKPDYHDPYYDVPRAGMT
jgi:hypothetical protein